MFKENKEVLKLCSCEFWCKNLINKNVSQTWMKSSKKAKMIDTAVVNSGILSHLLETTEFIHVSTRQKYTHMCVTHYIRYAMQG